eukprot:TRINITY_DN16759_c0_g1_i3.p1 TRINITY_DN16759_c0_g1~~TRINITY_DN16759_c0_g1_i3.p1  ORF type:complete len:275 (-),score=28.99 TRINITY_DN16759_c0_g1_i3:139-963(-)
MGWTQSSAHTLGRVFVVCFLGVLGLAAIAVWKVATDCCSALQCAGYAALELLCVGNIAGNYLACVLGDPGFVSADDKCGRGSEFCSACRFYRPAGARHCLVCENCVHGFDHHCPWIHNCLGKRNRRPFFRMLLWLVIGCLIGAALTHRLPLQCWRQRSSAELVVGNARFAVCGTKTMRMAGFACSLCVSVGLGMGVYLALHAYLILAGQTSVQLLADWNRRTVARPVWGKNWKAVFGEGWGCWLFPTVDELKACWRHRSSSGLAVPNATDEMQL